MNRKSTTGTLANVLLVTLTGCDKCKRLVSSLEKENISTHNIDCDNDPNFCDELEEHTETSTYPMALTEYRGSEKIHYVAESYEDLKKLNVKKNKYILHPYASLEQMIEALKQIK
jgi:glutaredoxin